MRSFMLAPAIALILSGPALAAEKTVRIEVTGLYCASCPYIAAQAITSVESATITGGFYDEKRQLAQYVVQYDDAVTTAEELANATFSYGYPAEIITSANSGS